MSGMLQGLGVSLTGLATAQKNLDIVNQNISNASTVGYSRQMANQEPLKPTASYDGAGMVGSGSAITSITRARETYLDNKFWRENNLLGETGVKYNILSDIQNLIQEPSDSGFTATMNQFMNSLQDLKKDPSSSSTRTVVKENAVAFVRFFNTLSTQLENIQTRVNQEVNSVVTEVNSIGGQIVKLNKQISEVEFSGQMANELRDKRGVLIDKLSKSVDIEVTEVTKGKLVSGLEDRRLSIAIDGRFFVNDDSMEKFVLAQRNTKMNPEDVEGLYSLSWGDGTEIKVSGGELRGYLDVRDGKETENGSPAYKGVPYVLSRLNSFVRTYVKAFNEGYIDTNDDGVITDDEDGLGHADGYGVDPDGAGILNPPGSLRFFTTMDTSGDSLSTKTFLNGAVDRADINDLYSQVTAKNVCVSSDIENAVANICASDDPKDIANTKILDRILELRNNKTMFTEGTPEDYVKATITSTAIDLQFAKVLSDNQQTFTLQADNKRLAVSGVSLDEEMTNMVKQQQAYAASAKMINTWAEIFDILVNRTGV